MKQQEIWMAQWNFQQFETVRCKYCTLTLIHVFDWVSTTWTSIIS